MISRPAFDLSVYFVLDPSLCAGRDPLDVARAAIRGGVTMIQLRNKVDRLNVIEKQARALLEITRPAGIRLLINDYIDIAFSSRADGVHLGQGDAQPQDARIVLGPDAIIGRTAFTATHMEAINPEQVDYVGSGPFYETQTDKGKPVLGAAKFAALVSIAPVPVVGIGGITPENAAAVIKSGAQGIAMMRGISEAADIEIAARQYTLAVQGARMKVAS